jgi:glutamate-1-semialdehyde aminotransferase
VGNLVWYAHELETQIALAVSMVPNIDKIRFVNSGTEAHESSAFSLVDLLKEIKL